MATSSITRKRKKSAASQGSQLPAILFNARALAFLLACLITFFVIAFIGLTLQIEPVKLIVAGGIVLFTCFILIFITLEFFIFREINRIYSVIEKLKKKDFKQVKKTLRNYRFSFIQRLNNEIFTLATGKENEINQLKAVADYRREFIADISHELRTPIFAAQGFIHTLIDGAAEDPAIRDRFLKKAANSLDGLEELVGELIVLSQLENGALQMHMEAVELDALIFQVQEQLESKAERKNCSIKREKKSDAGQVVFADAKRLRQVLINLVENGIKYGNEGGNIYIGVEYEKESIEISVRDDGPGIPGEHLKRIFERFYRVEKSRNKEIGGSGLGLSIVKHIIDAHHSKVSVVSKLGKGTTFSFKLRKFKPEMLKEIAETPIYKLPDFPDAEEA